MKIHYAGLIFIAVIVLLITGTVSAADQAASNSSAVFTNVWFAKMTSNGDSYTFELLPTGYVGLNDYGRMTFITGSENLTSGEYAIIQETPNGTALLKVLRISRSGTIAPNNTVLTLELNKEDLAVPLDIPTGVDNSTTIQQAASPASTLVPAATATAAPTTKAPVGIATILAGLCIAGCIGALRLRR